MTMRVKVSPPLTDLLTNRIYISRKVKLFSLEEIAKAWDMSRRTLFRYDSPHDREVSRKAAKRATIAYKKIDKTKCAKCHKPLKGHSRCKLCTILVHGVPDCSCHKVALTFISPILS